VKAQQKVSLPVAIAIGLLAVAVAGGAGYFLFGRTGESSKAVIQQAAGEPTDQQQLIDIEKAKAKKPKSETVN